MVMKEVKSKKAAEPKARKSSPPHPTYLEMIGEAIGSLKERTGSSKIAIVKFIEDKHKEYQLPPNFKKLLLVQLKKLTASGKLTKIKNSYKLSASAKNPKPAAADAKPKTKVAIKPKVKSPVKKAVKVSSAKNAAPAANKRAAQAKKAVTVLKPKVMSTKKVVKSLAKPKVKSAKKVVKSPAKKVAVLAAKKAKK